jgi:ParB/RepB/Spo0J family partition protein
MPKRTRRTDLSALVEKYQGLDIVSEIEHNLLSANRSNHKVDDLVLNDLYNEKNYCLEKYQGLQDSLRDDGFLVPLILVKREDDKFEIINGVKRYLLGKKLGYSEMPCVLADLNQERKHAYIIQNILSEGDCPLVKTEAFLTLEKKYNYSDIEIAKISSLSLNQVRNLKRLSSLPEFLKEGVRDFTLSYSEARALLNLPENKQKELYEQIRNGMLSVRDLEKIKRLHIGNSRKRKVTLKNKRVTISFATAEEAKKFYPMIVKEFSD